MNDEYWKGGKRTAHTGDCSVVRRVYRPARPDRRAGESVHSIGFEFWCVAYDLSWAIAAVDGAGTPPRNMKGWYWHNAENTAGMGDPSAFRCVDQPAGVHQRPGRPVCATMLQHPCVAAWRHEGRRPIAALGAVRLLYWKRCGTSRKGHSAHNSLAALVPFRPLRRSASHNQAQGRGAGGIAPQNAPYADRPCARLRAKGGANDAGELAAAVRNGTVNRVISNISPKAVEGI